MSDQSVSQPNRKPIFDAVRRFLGRGFRQSEVDVLEATLDGVLEEERAAQPGAIDVRETISVPHIRRSEAAAPRQIGEAGIALIKAFEGCARLRRDGMVEAYPDPGTGAEPWTIGWGATGIDDTIDAVPGQRIGPSTLWTQTQCDDRLARDLMRYAQDVAKAIGAAPTSQSQFDAMVSFHYNTGAIARATLTKKHVAGDYAGAAAEFSRWNWAGGRVLKGLVRRRAQEAKLYTS